MRVSPPPRAANSGAAPNGKRNLMKLRHAFTLLSLSALWLPLRAADAPGFGATPTRIPYNNPGLRTDIGVGLWGWPLPMDYNHDGLIDMIVVCSGRPYNGVYFYENTGVTDPESGLPLFKAGVRLGKGIDSAQLSVVAGQPVVTTAGEVYPDFAKSALESPQKLNAPSVAEIFDSSDPSLTKP